MVRPSYRVNLAGNADGTPFFGFIFDPAGEGQADPVDLRGGRRAPRRFIGWQTFFDFGGNQAQHVRPNKRIDTAISTPLFNLPLGAIASGDPPTSLPQRNLLRHLTWAIPSGQRIAQAMGQPSLDRSQLQRAGRLRPRPGCQHPAVVLHADRGRAASSTGSASGPVGGRIVGEVFIGLLQLDPRAVPARPAAWSRRCPARPPGTFKMTDLLRWARVDPASRGQ